MILGLGTTSQQPGKISHTSIQSAHLRIKQILQDVADFAEIGRAFDPYAFAGSVLTPLAQRFLELESFAGETDEQLAKAVLADPDDFSGFEFVEYGEPIERRVPYDKTFTVIRKFNLMAGGE